MTVDDRHGVAPRCRCYTLFMPTTRPRHTVTETPEIAAILDSAALRYPDLSRQQLVRAVILEGGRAQSSHVEAERARLSALFADPDPVLTGLGGAAELQRMRDEDWPE